MRIITTAEDTEDTIYEKLKEVKYKLLVELSEGEYEIIIQKPVRSNPQNNAIHLYCSNLAKKLNDSGQSRNEVLNMLKTDLPWSLEGVKELLWKTMQKFKGYGTKTSKLKTNEVTEVYLSLIHI